MATSCRPSSSGNQGLRGEALAVGVRADAVADLGRACVRIDIGEVDPADDPVSFAGEHHEIEAGSVAARPVHGISQPPVHIRWMPGCFHQRGR
jgi:hypothetical protein